MADLDRGEDVGPREEVDGGANEDGGRDGEPVVASTDAETGAHGEEDEANIARCPDGSAKLDDRENGEHAKGGGFVAADGLDHDADDGAENEEGVDVVLGVLRAAIGALVGGGDEASGGQS